ncbi:MAG: sigma-70 factor domain-containing protein, partial [Cyanobacteria bacterium J06636_27]
MNQANNVLENIYQPSLGVINQPEMELEILIDEEEEEDLINEGEEEEFVGPGTGDAAKAGKAAKSRRRTQAKKKHYTEDSIRLYLQEIGRIRLLRADEEIELARKIADLLELERVGDRLVQQLERQPQESEWAEA